MSYTDKEKIQNYLQREITEDEEANLPGLIEAADRFIDNYANRSFGKPTEDEVRYFDGNGKANLYIDDCLSIESVDYVDIDGDIIQTLIEDDNFVAAPYNKAPITMLRKIGSVWHKGIKNYKITASWGNSAGTPKNVEMAATMIVADTLNNPAMLESENIEGYGVTFGKMNNPVLQRLLDSISSRIML